MLIEALRPDCLKALRLLYLYRYLVDNADNSFARTFCVQWRLAQVTSVHPMIVLDNFRVAGGARSKSHVAHYACGQICVSQCFEPG